MKKFKIMKLEAKVKRLELRVEDAETLVANIIYSLGDEGMRYPNVTTLVQHYKSKFKHTLIQYED